MTLEGIIEGLKERGLAPENAAWDAGAGRLDLGRGPGLMAPLHTERKRIWRKQANASLLPQTTSAESRKQMLFAVLQDLLVREVRLNGDGTAATPLSDFDSDWAPFDAIHCVPGHRREKPLIFPIHIAVPAAYDSYARDGRKQQTAKGIRGAFLDFFQHSATGTLDPGIENALRDLFAEAPTELDNAGFSVADRALLRALSARAVASPRASAVLTNDLGKVDWNRAFRSPMPQGYRPLPVFEQMGGRLRSELLGLCSMHEIPRIDRVDLVERALALHFAAYFGHLPNAARAEAASVRANLSGGMEALPWTAEPVVFRYHHPQTPSPRAWFREYEDVLDTVNLAFPVLVLLNNVEQAIRAVLDQRAANYESTCWLGAMELLRDADADDRECVLVGLRFLAVLITAYVDPSSGEASAAELRRDPIGVLWRAIETYYRGSNQSRYPQEKHQYVLEKMAGQGPTSFIQGQPHRHFALGDQYIFLRVLLLCGRRDDTAYQPGPVDRVHMKVPLAELFARLEEDLVSPADEKAREAVCSSLARMGLLERFSDVGDANFVRHPLGRTI